MNQNLYEFFNIPLFSSVQDIKKSYRSMALKYHPDRGGSEEKMKIINEMYELLISRKEAYDESLRQQMNPVGTITAVFHYWSYS